MVAQKFHLGNDHVIRLEVMSDRLRFYAEGPSGDGRFLEIVDGGGHIEILSLGSITGGTGLELDENGRVIIHEV